MFYKLSKQRYRQSQCIHGLKTMTRQPKEIKGISQKRAKTETRDSHLIMYPIINKSSIHELTRY